MKSRLDELELDLDILPRSRTTEAGVEWALARKGEEHHLVALVPPGNEALLDDFEGRTESDARGTLLVGPAGARNAAGLRSHVPWLRGSMGAKFFTQARRTGQFCPAVRERSVPLGETNCS